MAYTTHNYRTKKEIKQAIAAGTKITCFQPGPFGPSVHANGTIYLEDPHYPEPHKWYGQGQMKDGVLISIK
jgi:coproporphyrinogen III oxidase